MIQNTHISPNDTGIMAKSDSLSIQNAVDAAKKSGVHCVRIPRVNARTGLSVWNIDKAIVLPSDIEVVLDNCYLRQANGSTDNVFRNFADVSELPRAKAAHAQNIVIRGEGNAVIDGGVHNGLTEHTQLTDGYPAIYNNNTIVLFNVRGFKISGIKICNQRWWAINLIHCRKGEVGHIDFSVRCDVPNQDGIDVRAGCSDICIHDITGRCGDDLIALSALGSKSNLRSLISTFYLDDADEDIHDIAIKDVFGSSYACALVALRNADGRKLYNITVQNVHDTDDGTCTADPPPYCLMQQNRKRVGTISPYAVVRIGQNCFFYDRNNVLGETYNISVTDIYARCNAAVMINGTLDKSYFGRIFAGDGVDAVVTTKSDWSSQMYGADIRDTVFENVFFACENNTDAVAFEFAHNEKEHTLENVILNNVFAGNCRTPVKNGQKGDPIIDGLYGKHVRREVTQ